MEKIAQSSVKMALPGKCMKDNFSFLVPQGVNKENALFVSSFFFFSYWVSWAAVGK